MTSPDARGVHRIATAEDIERVGTEDERPSESYWVGFTDGAIVYTVDLFGPPGSGLRGAGTGHRTCVLRPADGGLALDVPHDWSSSRPCVRMTDTTIPPLRP